MPGVLGIARPTFSRKGAALNSFVEPNVAILT